MSAKDSGTTASREESLRAPCQGVLPLDARLEPWMISFLASEAERVAECMQESGSPLNILNPAPLTRNVQELNTTAADHGVSFRVYFARKANKCLTFVDAASRLGAGVDVASEQECQQALDRGVSGRDVICTAAVKTKRLFELCVQQRVTVAIDNSDEWRRMRAIAREFDSTASVALRVSGFRHQDSKLHSRFGFDVDELAELVKDQAEQDVDQRVRISGLHFHLDGYCAEQRISAVRRCLELVDELRDQAHDLRFLDIGGGLPMCYLKCETQWRDFWTAHRDALFAKRPAITYRNHGLGRVKIGDSLHGTPNVYPYFQSPVRAAWLDGILAAPAGGGGSIGEAIRRRSLELRVEPGRSILDGCGMTVARVEFTKQHHTGDWFIGLAMNRTQCRTSSDDFMVDPLLLRMSSEETATAVGDEISGYLVGAYCTESELLTVRKLRFPHGISVGDLLVFPNTAGYLMHFLESRSHQFPLAKNAVITAANGLVFDDIDEMRTPAAG